MGLIQLKRVHHISIICSDPEKSKRFYCDVLGFEILRETFRKERQSLKIDLSLNNQYLLELFTFPDSPKRPTRPEAIGLRHLAFEVVKFDETLQLLLQNGISAEPVRMDEITKKRFTFISDPDGLPVELCES